MQTVGETSGGSVTDAGTIETTKVQKRTIITLLFSQASGGVGLVATYIVSALLAFELTGSKVLATCAASRQAEKG